MQHRTIKIRTTTYRALKLRAAEAGETMVDLLDRLLAQDATSPLVVDRLQSIRDRFTREDTGEGFGRAEVAWSMADDLRQLIDDLTISRQRSSTDHPSP